MIFGAHGGIIGDLSWAKANGISEVGYVCQDGGLHSDIASSIRGAGMSPVLNTFNDNHGPDEDGSGYAGLFSACRGVWDMEAGEGCSASVTGYCSNYLTYENYGGIVGSSQGDMYAGPWSHATGGYGHQDILETYDNSNNVVLDGQLVNCLHSAASHGSAMLGLLIGIFPALLPNYDANQVINFISGCGVNISKIVFWGGYNQDAIGIMQGSGLFSALKSHYGASSGGGGGGAVAVTPTTIFIQFHTNPTWWWQGKINAVAAIYAHAWKGTTAHSLSSSEFLQVQISWDQKNWSAVKSLHPDGIGCCVFTVSFAGNQPHMYFRVVQRDTGYTSNTIEGCWGKCTGTSSSGVTTSTTASQATSAFGTFTAVTGLTGGGTMAGTWTTGPHLWLGIADPGTDLKTCTQTVGDIVHVYGLSGKIDNKSAWVAGAWSNALVILYENDGGTSPSTLIGEVNPPAKTGHFDISFSRPTVGMKQYYAKTGTNTFSPGITVNWVAATTSEGTGDQSTGTDQTDQTDQTVTPPAAIQFDLQPVVPVPQPVTTGITVGLRDKTHKGPGK